MKKQRFLTSNHGTTMILFALMFVVLISFTAIVVDYSYVSAEQSKLQNTADAVALAAAYELPDVDKALEAAEKYTRLNGYEASALNLSFSDENTRVKVKVNKRVQYLFARVMGYNSQVRFADATAEEGSVGEAFNYTVFSGSKTVTLSINGSNQTIDGSTHTNYNFVANGSQLTITGECEAVSIISVNGSQINIQEKIPHAEYIEMPDFSETIRLQAENVGKVYYGDKIFNGGDIEVDTPIYVRGNVSINGSHFKGKGCILATGTITFNGSNVNASSEDAVCFYSQTGSIYFNGSNAMLDGILFAPNGNIIMNGSNQTVNGRVIANSVAFNGSGLNIIGGTNELKSLPKSGIKLVE